MPEYRALIADDEAVARQRLRRLLALDPGCELVGECVDGAEAIHALDTLRPDLLFLDIHMPVMHGFDVLKAISGPKPLVIVTSAMSEHAARAFDFNVFDYLLKPFSDDRFHESMRRARSHGFHGTAERMLVPRTRAKQRVAVRNNGRVMFVKTDDVDWIEAADNYVSLHCGQVTHLIRETMSRLEARLDPLQFVRVHRSAIVNLERIRELRQWFRGEYRVILQDGTELTLTKNHRQRVESLLLG